jgi:4-hydroxy-tetrahydrodipicolinate synthase
MPIATLNLSGVIPPMITPLTATRELDTDGLEGLVHHLIEGGVSGLFVLGSSGEGPWLTLAQQRRVIEETVRVVAGRVPVLAGVLEPSTTRVLEAVEQAEAAGAAAVVVASPYYFTADDAAQFHHFKTIVNASSLPVVLYNIPGMTHNPISAATVQRLLDIDTIIGIKDSSGDSAGFAELMDLKKLRPDFRILQGAETKAAEALLAGADGLVSGLANLAPEVFARMVRANAEGDLATVAACQEKVLALWELHTHGFWLECLKYAASLQGFGNGSLSCPTDCLPGSAREAIEHLLQTHLLDLDKKGGGHDIASRRMGRY